MNSVATASPPLARGVSVVVPVYNSASTLPELVARLGSVLAAMGQDYELILVNDGSRDLSWDVIRDLAARHSWLQGFCLMRNFGQHNAVLAGIRQARFDVTVTLDDDLQHSPEELPRLVAKLSEGFDVVYGVPEQGRHGFWRNLAARVVRFSLRHAMGLRTAPLIGSFRAFKTSLRDALARQFRSPFVDIDGLLAWGTARFGAVPIDHVPRAEGRSNYSVSHLIRHAVNMMTGFSGLPLRLCSVIGFVFTLFGLGVLGYVLVRYLISGDQVAGFPFLASIIAIFSGAQLFALGIFGEYLARMHFRLMEKPAYVVAERAPGQ